MNILLNKVCNLTCPYCFFQGSLNEKTDGRVAEISVEDFEIAIGYACQLVRLGYKHGVNLIGGEPTLHPYFRNILQIALSQVCSLPDGTPPEVNVFSNGLFDHDTAVFLASQPCGLLFNTNQPSFYHGTQWQRLQNNLTYISQFRGGVRPFSLSLNLFNPEQETEFIVPLMTRLGVTELRVDLTRPNSAMTNAHVRIEQTEDMIDLLVRIARECSEKCIQVVMDCCVPICCVSDAQIKELKNCDVLLSFMCSGAVDVGPDLEVFYCGPLQHLGFGRLNDFTNARDLVATIESAIEPLRWGATTFAMCKTCKWRSVDICQGGCLAFKPVAQAVNLEMVS